MKSVFSLLFTAFMLASVSMAQVSVTSQVSASTDDAEEQGANGSSPGSMDLTSSDLELVRDGNDGDQWVGMRFDGLAIPQGAYITSAYIQFTVDEDDTLTGNKHIWAEFVDNATTFSGSQFNISSRPRTADSVIWTNIPVWPTVGMAGPDQQTPNLASLVQAVVNRPGWNTGNAMNILMHGTGERVAESYDGTSSSAPVLHVSYMLPNVVSVQVDASSDDAEEQGANGSSPGSMDLTSSDLELVRDGNDGDQWVGMRFNGLTIPQGSFIADAYIQFTVDEDDTLTGDKHIFAELVDNSTTFGGSQFNISSRPRTADSIIWTNIPVWPTVGASGPDQRTAGLATLVQTIVNRPGWASGNSMNILMHGTGERVAESYDGSSSSAPVLVVSYLPVTQLGYQVDASSDDAEEQGANGSSPGSMDLTSSDLELVRDGNDGDQFVGMRFNNISVPQGSVISHAYIQFTVDEDDTLTGDKFIRAEYVDNSTTFGGSQFNISSRPVTSNQVQWTNIPVWPTVGMAGPDQQTPNLASIVQEVVNRPGWAQGNSMNIIMSGTGERVAESYDGSSSSAPQLFISYVTGTAPVGSFPIDSGTVWAYHDSGFALSNWTDTLYNDTTWAFGPAQLGYGDGDEATVISYGSDANNKYPTYYFRHNFQVTNAQIWDSLRYSLKRDDGAIVYLNGQEIFRQNMPTGAVTYNTLASSAVSGAAEDAWNTFTGANVLVNGLNTIAVEVHQSSVTSSDVTFDFQLNGILPPVPVDTFPLAQGGTWYYLDNGTNQDTAWREFSFDPYAQSWNQGDAQLGYGDADETTVIEFGPDPNNKYVTSYFYKEFVLDTAGLGDSLQIGLLRDDAAAVYLNGTRVILDNLPATYDYQTLSLTTVAGAAEDTFYPFNVAKSLFNNGLNSIAVEVHQRDVFSSDVSFDLYIDIIPDAPIAGSGCTNGILNHIGCFTSIDAIGQTPFLTIPESHAFQVIFQQGDAYDNFAGVAPGNHDFTGYVPANGSSTVGYVDVNHETTVGGVSVLDVHYNAANRVWITDSINRVDFYNNALQTTQRNCSGTVTPWETSVTCEETFNFGDMNNDGYEDVGWNVEVDPVTRQVVGNTKLWAMGRMSHENIMVTPDSAIAYQGEDGGSSCVFKYVLDTPGDLSAGTLYVLHLNDPMNGGEPTGTTGQWIMVPNTTQADRNNTRSLAMALGGTNFNGVEDCEISPLDGKIYFTSKGNGRVYRFTDNGTGVGDFETFVGGKTYNINIGNTVISEPWAGGNDNLDFDDLGNLWVNQDGSDDYIWMVLPTHTQSNPKVELFASTPNGSESTGITFTPDHKFMFLSIQHPSSSNGSFQDVTGQTYAFDKSTTIVIARKEYLGTYAPQTPASSAATQNAQDCEQVDITWTAGNGDRRLVIAKEGSAVDALPVDGMTYMADANFGAGDDLGNGNYVIYDGTGTSVQLTGIDDQDEYHFAVVEYTDQFGSKFYNNQSTPTASFEFDAVSSVTISGSTNADLGDSEVYSVTGTTGYDYNWSVTGGTITAGQNTPSVTVDWTNIGNQDVMVVPTSDQGCLGTDVVYVVEVSDTTTTGINTTEQASYRIFPNPTAGLTSVSFDNISGTVTLFDNTGQAVQIDMQTSGNQVTFDASNLATGMYIIRVALENGEARSHQLIVK